MELAVAAWRLVLAGRFRLLERWCTFARGQQVIKVVTEDTWRQVSAASCCGWMHRAHDYRKSAGWCAKRKRRVVLMGGCGRRFCVECGRWRAGHGVA